MRIVQIIQHEVVRLGDDCFNVESLQRPDKVCGASTTTLQFSRLVQISNIHERGSFFVRCNRSKIRSWRLGGKSVLFDRFCRLFANQTSNFVIQSRWNNFGQPFDPFGRPLILWQAHFDSILMPVVQPGCGLIFQQWPGPGEFQCPRVK